MSIFSKSAKVLTVLSFGLLSTQVLAQDFCNATHSGTSTRQTLSFGHGSDGNKTGNIGDYHYEVWTKSGNAEATFYSDGSFSCAFSNIDDYLCREGIFYGRNSGKDPLSVGHIYADFSMSSFKNNGGISYAYVGIYGWMQNPLIEWYIVDNWGPASRPNWLGTSQGEVTIAGDVYEIFTADANRASIEGSGPFKQIYSLRTTARNCGTIDITAHFQAWKNKGITLGTSLYEAKILGEAGQYPENGNASGSIDFNYAKVYISNGTNPSSSSSGSNPTSSSATVNPVDVTNIPGTIELENFATSGGDEVTIYSGSIVGGIKPKAWLEYPISVTSAGAYTVELLAAREDNENRTTTVDLSVDGTAVGSITGILTTGWNDFDSFTGETTNLSAGTHTLRVTFTGGYVNVDNLKFTKKSTTSSSSAQQSSSSSVQQSSSSSKPSSSSQAPVVVATLPGTLQFEAYQNSGGEFKNNGSSLGSIKENSWVEYTVDFTSAGAYEFMVHVARQDDQNNKSHLSVSIDGTKVGTVTDILTTGWTDFQDFSTTTSNISAGQHTLRVTFDYGWVDADYMKFTKVSSSSAQLSSSSSEKQSSSSALVVSSSSEEQTSSASEESSSSSLEESSSSTLEISSSSAELWSSSATMALVKTRFLVEGDRNLQVFDMQGRFLGRVTVVQGVSLEQVLLARFQKPGVYLVKQGGSLMQVRVTH